MATGDQDDMQARLRSQIPPSWFPEDAPVLAGLLAAFAAPAASAYGLITASKSLLRLSTMWGAFLDLFALDFFGRRIRRRSGELDDVWRQRIAKELLRERCTRAGMVSALTDLTGTAPTIVEPWNPADCGAYDIGAFAYDEAGCWGDTNLPYQSFIVVKRPGVKGVPGVAGYDAGPGGYDAGAIEYIDDALTEGAVTEDDVYDAIRLTKPAGTLAWVRFA